MRTLEQAAASGVDEALPEIECFPNKYPGVAYVHSISVPEWTSICPKTGQPDYGTIEIRYIPGDLCMELKSFKEYIQAYRNQGIFYEVLVNRLFEDVTRACAPKALQVRCEMTPRGGISSILVRGSLPEL
jgi:7-cyano-7-deazaguanine reductase